MAQGPLRVLIYDDTCRSEWRVAGLTHSWKIGDRLYKRLGRFDVSFGARTWEEALAFVAEVEPDRPIDEIQYWGHGKWGAALLDRKPLTTDALHEEHPHHPALLRIKNRLASPNSLMWFRVCELFGGRAGHAFADAFATFFNCRIAGHTHIIGPWQSGLYCLRPGERPFWPQEQGILEGTAAAPEKAYWSSPKEPNTISCLRGNIPDFAYSS